VTVSCERLIASAATCGDFGTQPLDGCGNVSRIAASRKKWEALPVLSPPPTGGAPFSHPIALSATGKCAASESESSSLCRESRSCAWQPRTFRGNRRDLNALMDTATPDIAFSPALARTIDDNRFQGREGMRAYFADVDSAWEEFRLIVDEYRDLGDRVLTLGRLEGRGRGSGAAVDTPQGGVADIRDGKVSCVRSYLDHGEALRAAGLTE
jgi:ketosteroid isomerase-like protein